MKESRENSAGPDVEVEIEPGTAADAGSIAELSALLGYPTSDADVRRRLEGLDSGLHGVWVARLDGVVVGWVHAFRSERLEEDPFAELGGLIVVPEQRGRGLGRRLLGVAEAWAAAAGCGKLRIRSHERRRQAHRFYQRVGYRRVKRQQVLDKRLDEEETT